MTISSDGFGVRLFNSGFTYWQQLLYIETWTLHELSSYKTPDRFQVAGFLFFVRIWLSQPALLLTGLQQHLSRNLFLAFRNYKRLKKHPFVRLG